MVNNCVLDITIAQNNGIVTQASRTSVSLSPERSPKAYTQVANPFHYAYDLTNTYFTISGVGTLTASQAVSGGYINGYAYFWNSTSRAYQAVSYADALSADCKLWAGFWVVQTTTGGKTVSIEFTPDPNFGAFVPSGDRGEPKRDDHNNWALNLQISTSDNEYVDTYNKAGIGIHNRDTYDPYDAFEFAPMANRFIQLYFPHPDWQEQPGSYTYDLRSPEFNGAKVWDFVVRANRLPESEITLSWDNIGDIPDAFTFTLDNLSSGQRIADMREINELHFMVGGGDDERVNFRLTVVRRGAGVNEDRAILRSHFR